MVADLGVRPLDLVPACQCSRLIPLKLGFCGTEYPLNYSSRLTTDAVLGARVKSARNIVAPAKITIRPTATCTCCCLRPSTWHARLPFCTTGFRSNHGGDPDLLERFPSRFTGLEFIFSINHFFQPDSSSKHFVPLLYRGSVCQDATTTDGKSSDCHLTIFCRGFIPR